MMLNCHAALCLVQIKQYHKINTSQVFPQGQSFSANQRFVGARANNFWQYGKHTLRKLNKFVEIWHLVYFNTRSVRKLGHTNIFLEFWAQLFQETLGTGQLAIKLEGTLHESIYLNLAWMSNDCKSEVTQFGRLVIYVLWYTVHTICYNCMSWYLK